MAALANSDAPIMTNAAAGTIQSAALFQSKMRMCHEVITMSAQTAGSAAVARVPIGGVIHGFLLWSTLTVGATVTFAVGISGSTAKYVAPANVDSQLPVFLTTKIGVTGTELAAEEDILLTTAAAALAASGELHVVTIYSTVE
jgi:hypothetical protein